MLGQGRNNDHRIVWLFSIELREEISSIPSTSDFRITKKLTFTKINWYMRDIATIFESINLVKVKKRNKWKSKTKQIIVCQVRFSGVYIFINDPENRKLRNAFGTQDSTSTVFRETINYQSKLICAETGKKLLMRTSNMYLSKTDEWYIKIKLRRRKTIYPMYSLSTFLFHDVEFLL